MVEGGAIIRAALFLCVTTILPCYNASMKKWVLGIDEAGRGPIAGPVAVGVVCLAVHENEWPHWKDLRDSKKLSEKKRLMWRALLDERAVHYAVELVEAAVIEEVGIVHAARRATVRAVQQLTVSPGEVAVLLDKNLSLPDEWQQEEFVKGDERIPAIALASIVAKTERDAYMCALDTQYPVYGFGKHKGYGTKAHYEALRAHGLTDEHRASWISL